MADEKYREAAGRILDLSKKIGSGEVPKENLTEAVETEFKKMESRSFYMGIFSTLLVILALFIFIKLFPGAFLVLKY